MSARSRIYRPGILARLFGGGNWSVVLDPGNHRCVRVRAGKIADVDCADMVSLSVSKGPVWHSLTIQTHHTSLRLPGLSVQAADQLCADLRFFVNRHLSEVISDDLDQLGHVDAVIRPFIADQSRYLAHADLAQALLKLSSAALTAIAHPLFEFSLLSEAVRGSIPASLKMLTDPTSRRRYNEDFLASDLVRFRDFFDNLDGRSLSDQQREACIRLEDSNLLVASAGSGKSATMVGKVAYVLSKGLYRPEEILVLAFNKSAADEIKGRIARQIGVNPNELLTRVTTFHALGRSIIQEVEGRPPQLANWVDHPAGEAKMIEALIEQLSRSNPEFQRAWIDLLVLYPKADLAADVFDTEVDYRRYISDRVEKGHGTIGTMAGVFVKSLQERRIANWLWLNSIQFEYETQIPLRQEDGTTLHLQPDFFYPATGTIHEHFAIDADGTSPFPNYVEGAASKREVYRLNEMDFFETSSAQSSDETLLLELEVNLSRRGILTARRSVGEVTEALQPILVKHYHQLVSTCIKHIRASHLTLDALMARAERLHDKERAKLFAGIVWEISQAYSRKLEDIARIDFDSMIADATRLVVTGRYRSPFGLILVDEFQDISEPGAKLVRALKRQNPFAKLFAVGDDWQSIYRFAGSDISFFTEFEKSFGVSWIGRLEQSYRSNQFIAEAAANFVQQNPQQLRKRVRSSRPAIPKSIRVIPVDFVRGKPNFVDACRRLLARLDGFLSSVENQWRTTPTAKLKVLILWRYNHLDPGVGSLPAFENIEVAGMSFHRSKGLEADYTILLDVSEGDFGVPSTIEDDELLNLVIPRPEAFPYAEERRLFYVALTRAKRGVFLLANARAPSHYIAQLSEACGHQLRFETVEGQELEQCPRCYVGHLVERRAKTGNNFIGCTQFPECKHTASTSFQGSGAAVTSRGKRGVMD